MTILNLVSGPRNISTALMYSFAQRPDTVVLDEPFYGVYLARTNVDHPGKQEVMTSQPLEEEGVLQDIFRDREEPVVFVKNMAHHIEIIQKGFLNAVTNIFLIRDPARIIASYAEVIEKPVMRDIGLLYQHTLFHSLCQEGSTPTVIDSSLLLENPESVLAKLCKMVDIPFYKSMLGWKKGPKPYDGVWAGYWYKSVHQSQGFSKEIVTKRNLSPDLLPLYEEARFYYEKLLPFAIRP